MAQSNRTVGSVNLSPGDLLDRASILKIKREKLPDRDQRLSTEYRECLIALGNYPHERVQFYLAEFYANNLGQWNANEIIFRMEEHGDPPTFDDALAVCRSIAHAHRLNKVRIRLKNAANAEFGSSEREEKSFARSV